MRQKNDPSKNAVEVHLHGFFLVAVKLILIKGYSIKPHGMEKNSTLFSRYSGMKQVPRRYC